MMPGQRGGKKKHDCGVPRSTAYELPALPLSYCSILRHEFTPPPKKKYTQIQSGEFYMQIKSCSSTCLLATSVDCKVTYTAYTHQKPWLCSVLNLNH